MLAVVIINLVANQKSSADASYLDQTHLSAEENPKQVVVLPEAVLNLLMTDEIVVREKACRKQMAIPGETRSSFFVATQVYLDGSRQPDFLTLGKGCFLGAHNAPFWMVRKTPEGFHIILSWVSDDLEILPTRTHGFHDLRLSSFTFNTISSTICKFDGQKYVSTKRDLEPWP